MTGEKTMTAIEHSRPRQDGLSRHLLRAASAVASHVVRLVAAEIDRRRTATLLGFEDHALRDIGITRADVYGALLTQSGDKPSEALAMRRDEARIAELKRLRAQRSAPAR